MAKSNSYDEFIVDGKRDYGHRFVAECMLGRNLNPGETVHHIDGNGHNNNPDNLWVFRSNAEHSRFHKTGVAIKQDDGAYIAGFPDDHLRECLFCGNKTSNLKYCSHKCHQLSERRVERPDIDELKKMIAESSFVEVGRNFGVSDNAIRKWLKNS